VKSGKDAPRGLFEWSNSLLVMSRDRDHRQMGGGGPSPMPIPQAFGCVEGFKDPGPHWPGRAGGISPHRTARRHAAPCRLPRHAAPRDALVEARMA